MPGFKWGLLIGGGIGFLLGSKAGHGPYESFMEQVDKLMGRPEVERWKETAEEASEKVRSRFEQAADRAFTDEEKPGDDPTASTGS